MSRFQVDPTTVNGLFRGEEVGGSHNRIGFRLGACRRLRPMGKPHVENLQLLLLGDHQIGRFDITMDHPLSVSVRESFSRLLHVVDDLGEGQGVVGPDGRVQRGPMQSFHDQKMGIAITIKIVGPHDVGVAQRGRGPPLRPRSDRDRQGSAPCSWVAP